MSDPPAMPASPAAERPTDQPSNGPSMVRVGSSPDPSRPRHAHFSQGGFHGGGGLPPIVVAIAPTLFLMVLGVLPMVLLLALSNLLWLPPEIRVAAASLLVLGSLWVLGRAVWNAYRRGTATGGLPFKMDETARVNVICWPNQRDTLEPLGDVAFEPELFRIIVPVRLPKPFRRARTPNALAVALLWSVVCGQIFLAQAIAPLTVLVVWLPILAATLAVTAWLFRKPTYLRVVPGRADLLRYPSFGGANAVPEVETFDLRTLPVRLDLKRNLLRTGHWNEELLKRTDPWTQQNDGGLAAQVSSPRPRPTDATPHPDNAGDPANAPDPTEGTFKTIHLWCVPQREAATRALYLASISSADHGPLPEPRGA